jgi:hypothetical protein
LTSASITGQRGRTSNPARQAAKASSPACDTASPVQAASTKMAEQFKKDMEAMKAASKAATDDAWHARQSARRCAEAFARAASL